VDTAITAVTHPLVPIINCEWPGDRSKLVTTRVLLTPVAMRPKAL
jgi:hypothetical protein